MNNVYVPNKKVNILDGGQFPNMTSGVQVYTLFYPCVNYQDLVFDPSAMFQ